MALDSSMMLPLLMSMMSKNKESEEQSENGNGMNMEMMAKMLAGMQSGNPTDLLSMMPQNDQTKGIMEMAKLLGAMNKTNVQSHTEEKQEQPQKDAKTTVFSADNPFEAVNGFCGNEVNNALNKLFNNK